MIRMWFDGHLAFLLRPAPNNLRTFFSQKSRAELLTCEDVCGLLLEPSGGGVLNIGAASKTRLPTICALRYQKMSRMLMRRRIFSKS